MVVLSKEVFLKSPALSTLPTDNRIGNLLNKAPLTEMLLFFVSEVRKISSCQLSAQAGKLPTVL